MSSVATSSGSRLRELLQRRRRIRERALAESTLPNAAALLEAQDISESQRLASGHAARPLHERIADCGVVPREQVEQMIRSVWEEPIAPLGAAESAKLRKAQSEPGLTVEDSYVAAGLATPEEIAHAYAEYLRVNLQRNPPAKRLGELLVIRHASRGLTTDVLDRMILTMQGLRPSGPSEAPIRIGQLLVKLGLVAEEEVAAAMAEQQILAEKARSFPIDATLVNCLPESFCREHVIVPVKLAGESLRLVMVNPTDIVVIEQAQQLSGFAIEVVVGTVTAVREAIDGLFGVRDAVRELVKADDDFGAGPMVDEDVVDLEAVVPDDKDARIVRLANSILGAAITQGASDVHLEPFEQEVQVRYRIDGQLMEVSAPTKAMFIPLVSRYKILARMDIAEKRIPQDGAICTRLGAQRVDLRVSVLPTTYGEKMVMRLLRRDSGNLTFEDLGFNEQQVADFRRAIHMPHGLMFVTRPTGSGKSTTLYSALNELNRPTVNITTVEDPVEQKVNGVNQVHVRSAIGLTFAAALRSILRQDPDIVMVGEVRDRETAEICLRAALTGHFVLSTLHTNDALSAIPRLTDMGVERFLLAATIRLLEAQRLVRRLCLSCTKSYALDAATAARVGLEPGITLKRPVGCKGCRERGYRGRVGIYEVVPFTPELSDRVQTDMPVTELMRWAAAQGQKFLADAAKQKAVAGLTSLEEAMSITMGGHG